MRQLYEVRENLCDRSIHLAFAEGNPVDIRRYYADRAEGYGIEVNLITPIQITPQVANERERFLKERKELVKRLKEIDSKL